VTLRSSQYAVQPSLKVSVSGWKPIVNGIMYSFAGNSAFDLTSLVPGSGHAVVLVALRSDFATLEAFASSAVPTNDPLLLADMNNALGQMSAGSTPVWAYDVPTGATGILDSMTLLDCRQLVNIAADSLAFPLTIAQGGTGETFLAPHGALVVNAAGSLVVTVAPSTSGNLLTSNGTDWTSAAPVVPASAVKVNATQTTSATVANTTSDSSLMGSVSGSMTYAAGALNTVGRTVRFKQWGVLSDLALTPGNITISFKLGSVVIVSSGAVALTAGLTTAIWELDILLTVRSTGASGTVYGTGKFKVTTALADIVEPLNSVSQPVTVDLTASLLADPRVQFSAASTSNTISSTVGVMEVMN
jgi:hypothetical protein